MSGINPQAIKYSKFPPILKFYLKHPGPTYSKKRFLRGLTTFHVYYWLNHVLVLLNKDDMLLFLSLIDKKL